MTKRIHFDTSANVPSNPIGMSSGVMTRRDYRTSSTKSSTSTTRGTQKKLR